MNAKTIWASIVLIILACLSTMLMIHSESKSRYHPPAHLDKKQNMFMTDVLFRQYDKTGKRQTQMIASLMRHYPYRNVSYFENPIIHTKTNTGIPWIIKSNFGQTVHGKKIINLWGKVYLHRPQRLNASEMTILTAALTYFPKRSFAQSDQVVTILQPGTRMSGKGMTANLKTNVVTSLSHSEEVYTPEAKNAITHR